MLFNGLMRQSEMNRLLNEIFGAPEGASLDEGEGIVSTLDEEGERENADRVTLLTA